MACKENLALPRSLASAEKAHLSALIFFEGVAAMNPLGMALFAAVARDVLRVTESVQIAGRLLADLITDPGYADPGFSYWSNRLVRPGVHRFSETETSAEAADLQKAGDLFRLSDDLICSALPPN